MYKGDNPRGLISLLIKIVIIVIFAILVIWLISKVANKSSNNAFDKNMIIMKNASIEYFKKDNLPKEEGENKKVTLGDLIKMKYITSFDKKCDRDKSYSRATMVDDYYALRVELLCGNKKKYIYTSIDKDGNCIGDNCDDKILDSDNNNNNEESSNNEENRPEVDEYDSNQEIETENDSSGKNDNDSNSNGNNSNENKTLYYEFVKVNKVYGDWQYAKISGNNVETKQEYVTMNNYCPLYISDYYVVVYYPRNFEYGTIYRNVIRLDNVSTNSNARFNLKQLELFDDNYSYYEKYLNSSSKNTVIIGNDGRGITDKSYILESTSLKSRNVTIKRSMITSGSYGVGVEFWLTINNINNVYNYSGVYFVPVHFSVEYEDKLSCVKDTSQNAYKYSGYVIYGSSSQRVTLYRSYSYQKNENDKKWSTNKTLEGYVATGKSEYR